MQKADLFCHQERGYFNPSHQETMRKIFDGGVSKYNGTLVVGNVLVFPCHSIVFELITLQTDVAGLRCGMLVEDDDVGRSKFQDIADRARTPSSHVLKQRQPMLREVARAHLGA